MRKYLLLLFWAFTISFTNAQVKVSGQKTTSVRLIQAVKINGFSYQVCTKNIKEDIIETPVPQENPNAPQVVTAPEYLMDYDHDATGEEYVLYRVNSKGKRTLEITFPKIIKNGAHKITTEGGYVINSNHLVVTFKRFDYHFPSEMTTVYSVDKYGRVSFVNRNEKALDTDSFSEDYIKKAKDNTIKSN
ncbi:hypothetical protein SAMN05518672_1011147 [Chitinophaga sp. CF118]|uniref:hypothetical protein n=1 Tax=Chitinophaga sp. CF118 TaxID=1884367 RepID=UPI0008EBAEC8|nr:hypothetical protein [Chitinophaga sp. CF118]SFD22863.1 hypothetical protein SAMN05518672_1011147 [Chitinophaga sp. CF118]